MSKSKVFYLIATVLAIFAFVAMFFNQINVEVISSSGETVKASLGWKTALYGIGATYSGSYRLGVFTGANLAALGYIFIGVGAVLFLLAFVFGDKGLSIVIRLLAIIFSLMGGIFVLCIVPNFKTLNDLDVGSFKSSFTYEAIKIAIMPLLAGIATCVGTVATVVGFAKTVTVAK